MPIIIKGGVTNPPQKQPVVKAPPPLTTMEEIRKISSSTTSTSNLNRQQEKENLEVIRKLRAAKPAYTPPSNLIKPKYVEDQSVLYKNSSYLNELLGEGK